MSDNRDVGVKSISDMKRAELCHGATMTTEDHGSIL